MKKNECLKSQAFYIMSNPPTDTFVCLFVCLQKFCSTCNIFVIVNLFHFNNFDSFVLFCLFVFLFVFMKVRQKINTVKLSAKMQCGHATGKKHVLFSFCFCCFALQGILKQYQRLRTCSYSNGMKLFLCVSIFKCHKKITFESLKVPLVMQVRRNNSFGQYIPCTFHVHDLAIPSWLGCCIGSNCRQRS